VPFEGLEAPAARRAAGSAAAVADSEAQMSTTRPAAKHAGTLDHRAVAPGMFPGQRVRSQRSSSPVDHVVQRFPSFPRSARGRTGTQRMSPGRFRSGGSRSGTTSVDRTGQPEATGTGTADPESGLFAADRRSPHAPGRSRRRAPVPAPHDGAELDLRSRVARRPFIREGSNVPRLACSKRPMRRLQRAGECAPSCPKQLAFDEPADHAPQVSLDHGALTPRLSVWIALARSPSRSVSPVSRIVESVAPRPAPSRAAPRKRRVCPTIDHKQKSACTVIVSIVHMQCTPAQPLDGQTRGLDTRDRDTRLHGRRNPNSSMRLTLPQRHAGTFARHPLPALVERSHPRTLEQREVPF